MPRVLTRLLAAIGGLWIISNVTWALSARVADQAARGVVERRNGRPAANVPVFLDRGAVIERYVTDTAGHFRLPLAAYERTGAVWLICAPHAIPMVGHVGEKQFGSTTYELTDVDSSPRIPVRGFGWRGPIPRECSLADSTRYWRGPVDSTNAPVPVVSPEPDWATYRSRGRL